MATTTRIQDGQLAAYDSLTKRFVAEIHRSLPQEQYTATLGDNLEVKYPGKHPDVGDLWITLEGEITVGIGNSFHTHFDPYRLKDESEEQAEIRTVNEAIEFVRDILEDRMVLEVRYCGDRCTGARIHPRGKAHSPALGETGSLSPWVLLDKLLGRKRSSKYVVWSGPYLPAGK